jgi:nitrilase
METVVAAAIHATPVFLDREGTMKVALKLIREATSQGARLMVFPETFIPTYPDWIWRASPWDKDSDRLYALLLDQSVLVPGPETERLGAAARRARAYVVMGVNESDGRSGTIYNTTVYLGPDGSYLGKHRKLMPTGAERLVWGYGDGSTLVSFDTPYGRLGGLTCWENYMPLARYAMYAQGVEIYVAPTWDNSEVWVPTLRHIAKEGRVFVIGVAPCLRGSDVPDDLPGRELWGGSDDWMSKGNSTIVAPDGEILAGPLVGEPGIVLAELDPGEAKASRYRFDPIGHYARPDVFSLAVDMSMRPSVASDGPAEGPGRPLPRS